MRVYLRDRASHVLLWSALIVAAVSGGRGVTLDAQAPAMRWDGLIELISGRYNYQPPTIDPAVPADGPSQMSRHAVSGDGRFVVFSANAPSLGGYGWSIYRRDRRTSTTDVLFSGPLLNGNAVISADGRHVAFTACYPWARPDQAEICDVWTIDTQTWAWTAMSTTPSGDYGDADSGEPVLSGTGRFVVFRTTATNLAPGSPAGIPQLVIRDRDSDGNGVYDEPGTVTLEIASAPDGAPGTVGANGASETAEVSDDGRYVAFRSAATDLVAGDSNNGWDVFRRDRLTQQTRRINLRPYPDGYNESPHSVDSPAISMTPDGRYVAFASADPLLAPASYDDVNDARDVFVFDAQSSQLERLDVGWGPPIALGLVPGNGPTEWPTLSADGRYVSVHSAATNVERPGILGSTHTYVADRVGGTVTRVSIKPDGTEPDRDCVKPSISADGSLVTFVSQAFTLAPNVSTEFDRVYAAVHFEFGPDEQFVPGGGGTATYTITTQQHTQWWIDWTEQWPYWLYIEDGWMGAGNGTMTVRVTEANPDPTPRSVSLRVAGKSVLLTQLEGLSVASVSPNSGPATGGTVITITGTGFEPGMRVMFDTGDAPTTEFVDSTTIRATTPAHAPGWTYVGIMGPPPDYRSAWIDEGFRYTDTTPPELSYYLNGELGGDGWYRSDVTLYWWWWDPESLVTSMSGCELQTIATDTPGATFTCAVTSEGGTTTLSATVKRDTTPPAATITSPQFRMYDTGSVLEPAFSCSDALSGVASCSGSTNGDPLDTVTPGYRTFWVSTQDRAGNVGSTFAEYAIGSGVCTLPPANLPGWWRLEGDTRNATSNSSATAWRVGLTSDVYVDGMVGQAYQFEGADGYLQTPFYFSFQGDEKLTLAAWVKPSADTLGTILRSRESYSVARLANGSIAWAFRKPDVTGLSYHDTGVKVPLNVWSHIAVVLDGTTVRTYFNGRVAHTATNIGDVYNAATRPITIGGADDRPDYFKGALDELQIFQSPLTDADIERTFLSGSAGLCVPKRTTFEIVEPIAASYGSATYAFDVRLVDETGAPVVGRTVRLESIVGAWPLSTSAAERATDADGRVHWDAPLKNAPRGLYDDYTAVQFDGDSEYVRQYAEPDVLVGKGTPVVTWPTPAAITYSYPVNATQLNATANVAGTFSYSVPSGTLLPAGTHTLTATFTPQDADNYDSVTAATTLIVNKAVPTVLVDAVTWSYTGSPLTTFGAVKDRFGFTIATPTLTYNGSPDPPVMPGSYAVVAAFAGNANYEPATANATMTITRASVDIVINIQDVTYDGLPHGAGTLVVAHPNYFAPDAVTYNGSTDHPVNTGTYTVVATFNGSDIYEPATETASFTIHKATPTVTVTGGTFTYDGTAHPAVATVTGGGGMSLGVPVLTYNGSPDAPVNGGTYAVVGTYAGDANHHSASGSATITINKTWPVVTVSGGTYTYDGQPHPATGTVTGVGGVQLSGLTLTYNGSAEPPVNAGGYAVTATYPGDANYHEVVRYTSVQINRAVPTVTVAGGTFTYDGQPHPANVSVIGADGAVLGAPQVTYYGSPDPPVNAGTYSASAWFPGDANHDHASGSATITITRAAPTVVVNGGTFVYDGQPHPATGSVTGVGGIDLGPLAFTYGGSPDAPVNAGSYTALGTYAGSTNYLPAGRQATITIGKATPTITVTGGTFTYDMYAHPATGTVIGVNGASLGAPSFTYNGSTTPPMNAGVYEVAWTFAGDANYLGASGTTTITIGKATPLLTWNQPAAIVYGTPLGGGQLNATAANGGGGVFTYSPPAGTVLNAGTGHALTVTFTPFNPQNYENASAATAIDVVKATPTISIAGGTFTYDGQAHPATGSVTGGGGAALGSPSFTYNGSPEPPVNAGSYAVVASYPGDDNHQSASKTATISITKGSAVLNWNGPGAIVYGTPLGAAQLNATANIAGTFVYWPAAGTVLNAGTSQWLSAAFTPADTANYHVTSTNTTIDVTKATPLVSVTGGTFTYDGSAHPATGSVTGVGGAALGSPAFTYNGSTQPPVNAGSYDVVASYAASSNYEAASATATIAITKAAPVLSWSQPAGIVYGTPLGAAQLNATANAAGTFTYAPAAGTILNAGGSQTLTATFTPANTNNYSGGSVSTSIDVAKAPLTIRANDAVKPFGAPLPAFTASGTGFVNGETFGSLGGTLAFATTATAQSAVGSYPVTPSGLSSANYAISFVSGTLTVARGGVTVAVTTGPEPSGLDQVMTFTASVAAAGPAAGAPGGTVRFFDGATLLGSSALTSGSASLTTAGLSAGVHTIEARYDGDASFEPGAGSSPHTVNTAAETPAIAISSNRNPANVGQPVTLTASVTMAAGPVTGIVEFYDGATLLGSSPIGVGSASLTTAALTAGSHAITVRYAGDASAPPVRSGVFVQSVKPNGWKDRSTSLALSASPNPSAPNGSVTLTANVTGSTGSMPTGRILFMVNGEVVGAPDGVNVTPVSGSTARATVVVPGLAGGQHAVTATYLGDSNYRGSTAAMTQTVN